MKTCASYPQGFLPSRGKVPDTNNEAKHLVKQRLPGCRRGPARRRGEGLVQTRGIQKSFPKQSLLEEPLEGRVGFHAREGGRVSFSVYGGPLGIVYSEAGQEFMISACPAWVKIYPETPLSRVSARKAGAESQVPRWVQEPARPVVIGRCWSAVRSLPWGGHADAHKAGRERDLSSPSAEAAVLRCPRPCEAHTSFSPSSLGDWVPGSVPRGRSSESPASPAFPREACSSETRVRSNEVWHFL